MNTCLDDRDLRRSQGATSPACSGGTDPDGRVEL